MDLSIVIVNWNTRDLLSACLASIYAYPPSGSFEIWVVDNASKDGSAEMVAERFPQVRLICNPNNVGFAQANNQAIRGSVGRNVLLLNPDAEVKAEAIEKLERFLESTPEAGAVGSLLLNQDGSMQVSCYPRPTLLRELWRLFFLDALYTYSYYPMERWERDQSRPVDILKGACILLRRKVLDQVGLMDEDYFMYSEEVDLCYSVQKAGWKLFWAPQAAVIHYGGQSVQQVPTEMFLQLYQGKVKYFRKHHGWSSAQMYKLILLGATLIRLVFTPLVLFERPSHRKRHLTLSDHYRRLLSALPEM